MRQVMQVLIGPNPVQNIQDLLNFRDPDKVIQHFLNQFRNEFMKTIPEDLHEDINKRNLIKNIKSLYRTKGTAKGTKYFLDYCLLKIRNILF